MSEPTLPAEPSGGSQSEQAEAVAVAPVGFTAATEAGTGAADLD